MPKMKTHKGAKKRIKVTNKKGKATLLRSQRVEGKAVKANTSNKRKKRKMAIVSKPDQRVIRKLLPGT